MRVLSGSMYPDIPQNSLILARRVNPNNIEVGDDITFLINETTTHTHRVVAIYENFTDDGGRGFRTQGVNNPHPDHGLVTPNNVVGRVVFSNLTLGRVVNFLRENVVFVAIFSALFIGFLVTMKYIILPKKDRKTS